MGIFTKKEIKDIVPEAYLPFSAYVIQTRALPDARDCLKTGGRYILWTQYSQKNVSSNPRVKANDITGSVMKYNPHGDAGIYNNLVRFAKPFSMRYPLEDAKGNTGTMTQGDDHTAARYLEIRASKVADEFFALVDKGGVQNWKLNYTQTLKYPDAFPTLFPNFVNGNTGIGVGCASSIPQYNLSEAIDSIKKLVYNPDIDFDEIYIAPDFATGGIIINGDEIKESLRKGTGKSIHLRSKIEYDADEHCLIITELPYQVFTKRIMNELSALEEEGKLVGIKNYFDGTDKSCGRTGTKICIYLNKNANPEQICKMLYKKTSLQSFFSVNCLMLEDGIKPKVFGQREMMLAYLSHMENCVRSSYQNELDKVTNKINILKGYLIAIAHIEEIVDLLKNSENSQDAVKNLIAKFDFNEEQAKAILELKLQRLVSLEGIKINNELNKYEARKSEITNILSNSDVFNNEIIKILDRIKNTYGDSRRTQIMNLDTSDDDETPIEKKQLVVHLTNQNSIYAYEDTTLIASRKGKGTKVKLSEDELITHTVKDSNYENLLMFSSLGKVYSIPMKDIPLSQHTSLISLLELSPNEVITSMVSDSDKEMGNQVLFITKNGIVKRTPLKEYKTNRSKGLIAIKLSDDDLIKKVMIVNDNDDLSIATKNGYFVWFKVSEIPSTGRNTKGVKGITLRENDEVCDASIITPKTKQIISITKKGLIKKTDISAFTIGSRANKGMVIHKLSDGDELVNIRGINETNKAVSVSSTGAILKFSLNEVRLSDRNTLGTLSINLKDNQYVTGMIIE